MNHELLQKAIDDYWQSKYPTFATGRIKRLRGITPNRWPRIDKRLGCKRYSMLEEMNYILFEKTMYGITRWNRH
jgi:hypothetical protein